MLYCLRKSLYSQQNAVVLGVMEFIIAVDVLISGIFRDVSVLVVGVDDALC